MTKDISRREFLALSAGCAVCACAAGPGRMTAPPQAAPGTLPFYDFLHAVETRLRQIEATWHPCDQRAKSLFYRDVMAYLPKAYSAYLQQTSAVGRGEFRPGPEGLAVSLIQ